MKKSFFTNYKIIQNHIIYSYIKKILNNKIGFVSQDYLNNVLENNKSDTVFLHIGLKQIKFAFNTDPYIFIFKKLSSYYKNILVPGFTPSFRKSGIYHKIYSLPEYGTFSKLFLKNSDKRTNDCIHSILIKGSYSFDKCNHQDSFGENSCYSLLDKDNILIINIGTKFLVSAQIHYIEHLNRVPYLDIKDYEGIIYYDNTNSQRVHQKNFTYKYICEWNRDKIEKYLVTEGVLKSYNTNGFKIRFFKTKDLRESLNKKIKNNPFYLIT